MSDDEDRIIVRCSGCKGQFVSKMPEPFVCPACGKENFIMISGEKHKVDPRHVV